MTEKDNKSYGHIIQGLDTIDVAKIISKKNSKFLAIGLQELEESLDKNEKNFNNIRKIFLDNFNDYTRSIMRVIFGDIEE